MKLRTLFVALAIAVVPMLAMATDYTYNVNYNFGTFTVNGTITTDTNSGVLSSGDIVDWNLVLNDGTQTLTLLGPSSGNNSGSEIVGPDVVASPTAITYDFTDPNYDAFIFQNPAVGTGTNYLCYQGVGGGCNDFNGPHIAIEIGSDAVQEWGEQGVQVIATAAGTPEPSTLALLGAGLAGLLGTFRRKLTQ